MRPKCQYLLLLLLPPTLLLAGCGGDDTEEAADASVVTTLDLTVASVTTDPDRPNYQASWSPNGNVYLFYSEEADLSYATAEGDGSQWPLMDVGTPYHPIVRYKGTDGQLKTLHPVSAYGTAAGGKLDNHSSVRYSQVHFDITKLSAEYGQVKKGCAVLVVIVLNDPQSPSWVAHPLQLRRNYLIHVSLPDYLKQTYVTGSELNAKWWQVEE